MKRMSAMFCAIFLVFGLSPVADAGIVDQSNLSPAESHGLITEYFTWEQTITSQIAGYLEAVEIFMYSSGVPEPEWISTKVKVNGAVVGSSILLYSDSGNTSLFFGFSGFNIFLSAGQTWAIDLTGSDWLPNYSLDITKNDAYTGGQLSGSWGEHKGQDMRFRQYVSPVPAPCTILLLGCGLAVLGGFRKKTGKAH